MDTDSSQPAFHAEDVDEVVGYRAVSALAIVGLLFGLASPLCLLSPLLLVIPLCGAVLSIVALRRIAASEAMLAGRWLATIGLTLCVASGVAAISRNAATRYLRTSQAEEFGRGWLDLLAAGDTEKAFRLTVDGARPPMSPEPGMPEAATSPYDEFVNHALIQRISAAGAEAEIAMLGTQQYERQSRRQFVVRQRFQVTPQSATGVDRSDPIEADLTLQRSRFLGERQSRWLVASYAEPTDNGQ